MNEIAFEQVKKLMRIIGGKAVIVEDGKPAFVISNISDYMKVNGEEDPVGTETELVDKINRDITVWKGRQREKELKQLEKELNQKEREISIVPDKTPRSEI